MSAVKAEWDISITCDCPLCGEYVDLTDADDFWVCRNLEICEHRTTKTTDMEVKCPECHGKFEVDLEY